jgi:hypothetical protein
MKKHKKCTHHCSEHKKIVHHGHYESADPMVGTDHAEKPKHFIAGAINHPGALRKELHIKKGKAIPEKKLKVAEKKGGLIGKRAHLAETLKKLRKHKK